MLSHNTYLLLLLDIFLIQLDIVSLAKLLHFHQLIAEKLFVLDNYILSLIIYFVHPLYTVLLHRQRVVHSCIMASTVVATRHS